MTQDRLIMELAALQLDLGNLQRELRLRRVKTAYVVQALQHASIVAYNLATDIEVDPQTLN